MIDLRVVNALDLSIIQPLFIDLLSKNLHFGTKSSIKISPDAVVNKMINKKIS